MLCFRSEVWLSVCHCSSSSQKQNGRRRVLRACCYRNQRWRHKWTNDSYRTVTVCYIYIIVAFICVICSWFVSELTVTVLWIRKNWSRDQRRVQCLFETAAVYCSSKQLHTRCCAFSGPEKYTCHDTVASSSNARLCVLWVPRWRSLNFSWARLRGFVDSGQSFSSCSRILSSPLSKQRKFCSLCACNHHEAPLGRS